VSVGFDFRVDIRPYSGYEDPSLPIASWISQAGAAGNASGGSFNMGFFFQLDGDPLISELFSLEQISFDTSVETNRNLLLQTVNMDNLAPNRPGSTQFWKFQIDAVFSTGVSAIPLANTMLPLWLGSPNRDEGDSGLRITTSNTDLVLYAATLQGYMWGPRSVLAQGGPRRPTGGLFGNG